MKRKTSLIVWGAVLLLAAYGIYDLVREVRRSYTSCYAHTYSHAIGQMMGPRFDSLTPRGEGIRIGVVDAGFGGLRDDRFTRRLRVADYLDLTDGDTTGFFRDDCDHGTRVTRNIGGFSNDTLLGLACKADYYLVKSDLEHGEPREDERRLCRALAWLAQRQVDVVNISLGYTVFDDFDGYTPQMLKRGGIIGIAAKAEEVGVAKLAQELEIGEMTLRDILSELEKPGRDPRDELPAPVLRTDVLSMEDLKPGMELTGTVRNVIDFGAFVDIGVHQDGLVHISRMADKFIRHPSEVVHVGDVVTVWVVDVDVKKQRIALTMVKGRA